MVEEENKKLSEPLNTFPCNSGLTIFEETENISLSLSLSHSLMCHFVSNTTFDLLLTRSEKSEDTKGLWSYFLEDEDYVRLDMGIVLSKLYQN